MRSLLLGILILVGCNTKRADPGPSCKEVTEHAIAVMKQTYAGHGDMDKNFMAGEIKRCEETKPPADERRCMLAAKTLEGLAACRKTAPKKP